jgi:hypothetical protein
VTTNKTYFEWLYSLIKDSNRNGKPYTFLMNQLHDTTFYSLVPNDDNRGKDGEDLRIRFMDHYESHVQPLYGRPCTLFEMLIALAYRINEIMIGEPFELSVSECFWLFIQNLDLEQYHDETKYADYAKDVEFNIRKFLERTYDYNGIGGIFPLKRAKRDQRTTEVWGQMADYLLEKYKF